MKLFFQRCWVFSFRCCQIVISDFLFCFQLLKMKLKMKICHTVMMFYKPDCSQSDAALVRFSLIQLFGFYFYQPDGNLRMFWCLCFHLFRNVCFSLWSSTQSGPNWWCHDDVMMSAGRFHWLDRVVLVLYLFWFHYKIFHTAAFPGSPSVLDPEANRTVQTEGRQDQVSLLLPGWVSDLGDKKWSDVHQPTEKCSCLRRSGASGVASRWLVSVLVVWV